jgi:hypothetical protein
MGGSARAGDPPRASGRGSRHRRDVLSPLAGALERIVGEKGLTDRNALIRYRDAWEHAAHRTPHGSPITLQPEDFDE